MVTVASNSCTTMLRAADRQAAVTGLPRGEQQRVPVQIANPPTNGTEATTASERLSNPGGRIVDILV